MVSQTRRLNMGCGNSCVRTPFFSFLKVLKNGQSVLVYRTRRAVLNDTKINSRS